MLEGTLPKIPDVTDPATATNWAGFCTRRSVVTISFARRTRTSVSHIRACCWMRYSAP